MKIAFVDIDEVLNSTEHPGSDDDTLKHPEPEFYAQGIDPFHIKILNEIIDKTGAVVVLSTSWRQSHPLNRLRLIFKVAGFTGFIIGDTPRLYRTPDGQRKYRYDEIQLWLDHVKPEAFVILDDIDMGPLTPNHVKTEDETGLQPEHVEQAVRILDEH